MSPVAKALHRRGFEHEAILHYWPIAAGADLAKHAYPVRLTQDKQGRHSQLVVQAPAAYSVILQHESEAILNRLTRYLGYRPAERIRIVR